MTRCSIVVAFLALCARVRQFRSQVRIIVRAYFQRSHYNSANCHGVAGFSIPNDMKHLLLVRADRRHALHRVAAVQAHAVMLDALQMFEHTLGRITRIRGLEGTAHGSRRSCG